MPFTIHPPETEALPVGPSAIVADRRLYLAADERTMVEDGDASAAFLLVAQKGVISGREVSRLELSLVDGRVTQGSPASAPAAPPEVKSDTPDENKMAQPDDTKGKRERKG